MLYFQYNLNPNQTLSEDKRNFEESGSDRILKIKNISGGIVDIQTTDFVSSKTIANVGKSSCSEYSFISSSPNSGNSQLSIPVPLILG
jgi:hypothetical protein